MHDAHSCAQDLLFPGIMFDRWFTVPTGQSNTSIYTHAEYYCTWLAVCKLRWKYVRVGVYILPS